MSVKSAQAAAGSSPAKRRRPRPYLLQAAAVPAAERTRESWLCLLTGEPERVARAALAWSPRIAVDADAVLVEVGGSRRLFGGLAALRADVERVFAAHGWPLRHALAPTPRAASWLARGAPGSWVESNAHLHGALGAVPLAMLDLSPELAARLRGFGLRDLGDVLRLPRAALARRLGREFCDALRCALGEQADPQLAWRAAPRFSAARSFDFEVGSADGLRAALAPLFAELAAVLRAGDRGVRRCTVVVSHRDRPPTRIRIGVLDAVRDTARLDAQLALHLERTPLPAPATGVALHAPRLEAAPGRPRDLFRRDGHDGWHAVVERLTARFGAHALYTVAPHDDHRPEKAFHKCGSDAVRRDGGNDAMRRDWRRPPRPIWLLPDSRPVDPTRYRIESGPERIESGWWDGGDVARDYFVARDDGGARGWLYRERRPPYRWYLHGWFA